MKYQKYLQYLQLANISHHKLLLMPVLHGESSDLTNFSEHHWHAFELPPNHCRTLWFSRVRSCMLSKLLEHSKALNEV